MDRNGVVSAAARDGVIGLAQQRGSFRSQAEFDRFRQLAAAAATDSPEKYAGLVWIAALVVTMLFNAASAGPRIILVFRRTPAGQRRARQRCPQRLDGERHVARGMVGSRWRARRRTTGRIAGAGSTGSVSLVFLATQADDDAEAVDRRRGAGGVLVRTSVRSGLAVAAVQGDSRSVRVLRRPGGLLWRDAHGIFRNGRAGGGKVARACSEDRRVPGVAFVSGLLAVSKTDEG